MAQYLGTVKLGGFYNNGAILKRPTKPWRNDDTYNGAPSAGDIPSMSGSMANYTFGNTPSAETRPCLFATASSWSMYRGMT